LITSIIFSKNRPLQLDLTLNTIGKNFDICNDVIVIYKTSDKKYKESYENLKREHPNVSFYEQSYSLFLDILAIIDASTYKYVCFFTDDNIVYRKVDINSHQLDDVFDAYASCLSLRIGANTTQRDYGDGVLRDDNMPREVFNTPPFIAWNRTSIPTGGYWAYPLSVDGHIFKRDTMLEFCIELEFLNKHYSRTAIPGEKSCWKQTPNEFESKLQRYYFDIPAGMFALEQSCVVNSPNNKVQDSHNNRSGDYFNYDEKKLLDKYESGARINLDALDFSNIRCPHTEIDILKGL
tara:strand:+ start:253 stop:1131 length:879 start_codon:yes stop_codon:yes gene_type:complete